MGRYTGPTHKLCRREGIPLCGRDDCPVKTRMSAPGQHGRFRRRLSDYGQQLREKQKLKRIYGVRERQFKRYLEQALGSKEKTGEVLLQILERRLDNVVYRAGFAKSRPQARQFVSHGLVKVNDRRVTTPSYSVDIGDKITFAKKDLPLYDEVVKPSWVKVSKRTKEAEITSLPAREDAGAEVDESLVLEFYSR
ncbi:30S ribosomal protein S4 [Candidatus Saccharibacteria bacterium]|nr:30S ribosomal protein S4 [Candidatus Saccharibacteria bacterium]